MSNGRHNFFAMVGTYLSLAFLLPVSAVVGYAIGYLLDRAFGTNFLNIVFLLFGIAGGFIELIRQVQKDTAKQFGGDRDSGTDETGGKSGGGSDSGG